MISHGLPLFRVMDRGLLSYVCLYVFNHMIIECVSKVNGISFRLLFVYVMCLIFIRVYLLLMDRYALDVNVERAEDVITHKRVLQMAENPANRPAFEVRLVQVEI